MNNLLNLWAFNWNQKYDLLDAVKALTIDFSSDRSQYSGDKRF